RPQAAKSFDALMNRMRAEHGIDYLAEGTINGQGYILTNNIQTLAQLITRNPSGSFALSASYNARGDGTYSQSPINTPFQGNFAGLGNTISGLHIESESGGQPVGFFQQTLPAATVAWINLIAPK